MWVDVLWNVVDMILTGIENKNVLSEDYITHNRARKVSRDTELASIKEL